jgi:surfactin synthase thioesterase subunit
VTLDEARAREEHTGGGFDFHPSPGGHFYLAEHQEAVFRLARESVQ